MQLAPQGSVEHAVASGMLASSKELGLLSPGEAVGEASVLPAMLDGGTWGTVRGQSAKWRKRNIRLEMCRIPELSGIKTSPGLCFAQKQSKYLLYSLVAIISKTLGRKVHPPLCSALHKAQLVKDFVSSLPLSFLSSLPQPNQRSSSEETHRLETLW